MPASSPLRRIWVLMATVFVDMLGFLMVLPLLPFYAERLGASPTMIGALVSTFALAQLITAPWWGRLSDRYGRRPIIIGALLASAVAYSVFALANTVWMLLLSRLIQGAGGGTVGVVQAYVTDAVEPDERSKALGWLTAATSAGVMIGPGIASLSAAWGPSAPGFVAAALCLANAVSAWLWLPESAEHVRRGEKLQGERSSISKAVWAVVKKPRQGASPLIWIYAMSMMAFMAMNGILALFLGRQHGVTEQTIGLFYMYVGAISLVMRGVLLGPTIRWLGEERVVRVGISCLTAGYVLMPLTRSVLQLALVAILVPIGTALLFPATTSLVSRFAPAAEIGQTMGVQQAFGGFSRLAGPLWAGAAFQYVGIAAPFWFSAVLMVGVGLFALSLRPARIQRDPTGAPGESARESKEDSVEEPIEVVSSELSS
jgi:multidrug resistance protein